jgi:uncharacterized membrane protein (DUF485 family)
VTVSTPGAPGRTAAQRTTDLLASPEFRRIVARRWTLSLLLTLALFVAYYGFVLLVAVNKELLARRIGEATTLGIPIGAGVIVIACVLTAIYVRWSNKVYDPEVDRLLRELSGKGQPE